MALSKASGRSLAPGGILDLLGLPWGVAYGDVKPAGVGVWGASYMSFPDRVCSRGGGIGMVRLGLFLPRGD